MYAIERPRGNAAITRGMSDQRTSVTSFANAPGRSVTLTKLSPTSWLKITYVDDMGFLGTGNGNPAFYVRALTDGNAYGSRYVTWHCTAYSGWRIDPETLVFIHKGVPAGPHTTTIQWFIDLNGSSEGLLGWTNQGIGAANFLLVEEIAPFN